MASPNRTNEIQPTVLPTQETQGTSQARGEDVLRNAIAERLSNLLIKAQELGFELATLDDPELLKHPVVVKAKELIKELKGLFELQRASRPTQK